MTKDTVAVVCAIVAATVAIVAGDCTTRSDFTAHIGGLSENFTAQIDRLRDEITGQIGGLRTDFRGINSRLRGVEVGSGRIEQRLERIVDYQNLCACVRPDRRVRVHERWSAARPSDRERTGR